MLLPVTGSSGYQRMNLHQTAYCQIRGLLDRKADLVVLGSFVVDSESRREVAASSLEIANSGRH